MAYWTIIGKGIEGDALGKSFGITLDTSTKKWTASGTSVGLFFATLAGDFKIVLAPENGTQLAAPDGKEAAFFTNLNGTTPVGGTGRGRASEKGLNFDWKLDSK